MPHGETPVVRIHICSHHALQAALTGMQSDLDSSTHSCIDSQSFDVAAQELGHRKVSV